MAEAPSSLTDEPTSIEAMVKEKVAIHFQLRQSMGFVEIEGLKVAEFKGELERMRKENEEFQRITATLRRDLTASQLFFNKEKKWPKGKEVADEAKAIAGRIRMKKIHSRRLSFS